MQFRMKNYYFLILLICSLNLSAQTTVNYPQRAANYNAFFSDSGGNFDNGADEFGMWANGADPKQSAAWRSFTDTGLPGGTPTTMAVNDSFTITVSATQASFGVIGVALLSSPSTTSWADRISNFAVQVNLNGNSGANDPWEVVSDGGTIDASAIGGSTAYADFKFKFTLDTANTMTVSINDGAASFNVTLNNQNITGYSVYFADDWNGVANANIYWKPTTEYRYDITLNNKEFDLGAAFSSYPNPVKNSFSINKDVSELQIFDLTGKMVKAFKGNFFKGEEFDISNLSQSLYIATIENSSGEKHTTKLVKL